MKSADELLREAQRATARRARKSSKRTFALVGRSVVGNAVTGAGLNRVRGSGS